MNGKPFPSLIDVTTEELNVGLESGQFTSVDLVNVRCSGAPRRWRANTENKQTYFARILEVNSSLHAVTELNPDALSIAASLDAERANGTVRG